MNNNIWGKSLYSNVINSYMKTPSNSKIKGTLLELNGNKIKLSISNEKALDITLNKPLKAEIGDTVVIDKKDIVKSKLFAGKETITIEKTVGKAPKKNKANKAKKVCYASRKVRISFVPNKNKLRMRKCIVEHPFGTIKRWCDGSYLLLKGNVKATADLSLSFLAYNMKQAINMIGVNALISKMQAI